MKNEEFDRLIASFDEQWNQTIVTYFKNIKNFLKNGGTIASNSSFFNCLRGYTQLIITFIAHVEKEFSPYSLTQEQSALLSNYIKECHETLVKDLQVLRQMDSDNQKYILTLPMPTLEEQMNSGQIFPDHPSHLNVSF